MMYLNNRNNVKFVLVLSCKAPQCEHSPQAASISGFQLHTTTGTIIISPSVRHKQTCVMCSYLQALVKVGGYNSQVLQCWTPQGGASFCNIGIRLTCFTVRFRVAHLTHSDQTEVIVILT